MSQKTSLYDILRVKNDAGIDDIKKSYRREALQHHPDKGGDPEVFKKINHAYDILSNPEKRRKYDLTGEESNSTELGANFNPMDIFMGMMGGMEFPNFPFSQQPRRQQSSQPFQAKDITHELTVTLEDLCQKAKKTISYTQKKFCENFSKETDQCPECKGRGNTSRNVRNGFLSITQIIPCNKCKSTGFYHDCEGCDKGIIQEEKNYTIELSPTFPEKYVFLVKGEGDFSGNLQIPIKVLEHDFFQRKGENLFCVLEISLKESLCGFYREIKHPSGKIIPIKSEGVVSPDTIMEIKKYGMTDSDMSSLEISYEIKFPDNLTGIQREKLEKIL